MTHDYFVEKVRRKYAERQEILSSIFSSDNAINYQKKVKSIIKDAFCPFPEKTALNAVITGVIRRKGYKVEKLIFESSPGVLVTANLYMPLNERQKHPAVVVPCGHAATGKAAYEGVCQRLVHSGFIVLTYDPFNQGERDQYYFLSGRNVEKVSRNCGFAHNMLGKQLELIGEFFGTWCVWDGVRALDYLFERPEVDKKHLGVTGNSGGGTLATWLWALDDRFTMAAPSCFITTFLSNLENELPTDCEQCPPGVIGAGLDMADFLIAGAPRPLIILGQKYDYFDSRGLEKSYQDVRKFYKILGSQKNLQFFIGKNYHGYHLDAQEEMTIFFANHAGVRRRNKKTITNSKSKTLLAAPQGEVIKAGSTPLYTIIREKADMLAAERKNLKKNDIKSILLDVLKIPSLRTVPHYRVLRPEKIDGFLVSRFAVDTEKNVRAVLKKIIKKGDHPPDAPAAKEFSVFRKEHPSYIGDEKEAGVYLPHFSSEADLSERKIELEWTKERPFYAVDVRGLGESMPDEAHDFFHFYGLDYMFHAYSLMLGESYLGRRVYDCICVLNLLCDKGAEEIQLYGMGQGAVIALFAAVLHPSVKKLVLKNAPLSFMDWVESPVVLWPSANFPKGILKYFDIEDCIKVLNSTVRVESSWDSLMQS